MLQSKIINYSVDRRIGLELVYEMTTKYMLVLFGSEFLRVIRFELLFSFGHSNVYLSI